MEDNKEKQVTMTAEEAMTAEEGLDTKLLDLRRLVTETDSLRVAAEKEVELTKQEINRQKAIKKRKIGKIKQAKKFTQLFNFLK